MYTKYMYVFFSGNGLIKKVLQKNKLLLKFTLMKKPIIF